MICLLSGMLCRCLLRQIDENVQDLESLVKEEANTMVVDSYLIDFSSINLD